MRSPYAFQKEPKNTCHLKHAPRFHRFFIPVIPYLQSSFSLTLATGQKCQQWRGRWPSLLLSHKLKSGFLMTLLLSFNSKNDLLGVVVVVGWSPLSDFASMSPQEVLFKLRYPAFNEKIIRVLCSVSAIPRIHGIMGSYNIKFIVDSVSIQGLDRQMSAGHSRVRWTVWINSLLLLE